MRSSSWCVGRCAEPGVRRGRAGRRPASATFSGVNPNSARATSPGAEAPKVSMATDCRRRSASQPKDDAASTARRGHAGGQHRLRGRPRPGPRTAPSRAATPPGPARPRRPAGRPPPGRAWTSLPVPTRTTSGRAARPRRPARSRRGPRPSGARSAVSASTGMPWRVSTRAVGPVAVDGQPPGLGALVGVGRPHHRQARAWPAGRPGARWAGGSGRPRPGRPSRGSTSR